MLDRPKLLWFGRPPGEEDFREAKNRGLVLEVLAPLDTPDFSHARAAVFWATPPHFESTTEALEAHLVSAIDQGLYLQVVVTLEGQRNDIERVFEARLPLGTPCIHHRLRTEPVAFHESPNDALLHNPGPAVNDQLDIKMAGDIILRADQMLLLRRAFHDCKSINLRVITGGHSGALTFLVDATLSDSNAGPHPMPYFAKLDAPLKLRDEMLRFRVFAEHHIAWNLRPNFVAERCLYGVNQGVLVGAFVRPSRSLWEVALAGDGARHIRSLFEETLGALRQEPRTSQLEPPGSVVEPLEQFFNHWRVPNTRVEAAKQFGGVVYTPRSLWRKLLNLSPQKWRRSAIHGDMHGENVRVRKEDVIVIDFAHATTGPMSADLASLEVWLVFKVPPALPVDRERWRRCVEMIYQSEKIDCALASAYVEPQTGDILSCVREIRELARSSIYSLEEYRRVLAVYLLRHATFPADDFSGEEDEFRRTYAYWLANRMITALCRAQEFQLEVA